MRDERGFAFIWALFLVILVSAVSSVVFLRSGTLLAEAATDRLRQRSFWAAEGGLVDARHALAADPGFAGRTLAIGACEVTTEVTRVPDGWRVVSVARPGGGRVSADLREAPGLPAVTRWSE